MSKTALVAGAGGALGSAICRELGARGYRVLGASRHRGRLSSELGDLAEPVEMELGSPASVAAALAAAGRVDVLVYNAAKLVLAPLGETTPAAFEESFRVNAFGAFACARELAPQMVERGEGGMVFVGATGSVRGGARSHAFASSKHALRGLAHSLAKELGPRGVHVAHLIIDGKIWGPRTLERFPGTVREQCIEPAEVARTIATLLAQPPSAWTFEMDLRPSVEKWS